MAAKTNILFTGTTEMGVSYSDNNGSAWYPTNSIRDADKLYSLCFKGNMLFAGSNFMIFRSNNNGKTWTQTAYDGSRVISLASNSQYLFAGSRNTHGRPSGDIECSSDNGNNWTTLTTGVFSIPVYTLAVNNSNVFAGTDDGVYRSTNNGNNWTLSNSGITNTEVSSIALSGTKIFAATSGGVFRSNNNGNSWAKFNNGLSDTVVTSLVFTTNENRVFAATASGIFYTTLAGTKWTKLNSGLTNLNILSLCTDNDFIYAGIQDMGIWKYSLAKMQEDDNNLQSAAPDNFGLLQNYPNPFNPVTKIKYTIAENSNVSLKIFDILGREIVTLVNQQQSTGIYEVTFDANNYSSGIYFYRLQAGNYNEIKKMILQK
jgi:photosystem II stability/assembly factor-like uncharacterized protein